jgi:hypothetical protein
MPIPKDWFTCRLTVAEAEARYLVLDERLGSEPIPFGFNHDRWQEMLGRSEPGDEIWEYSSPRELWAQMMGRSGIALVRRGEVVDSFVRRMNCYPTSRSRR